ncbi:MAG TPA: ATP-dependent DNA helicase [Terriglobales bacterium]|nr:ATP-dependent DNA helicase [Terriglobales bacterium]
MATQSTPPAQIILPDESQREAIAHGRGPMLVVAGAGTGKTTVLVQRIVRLIREHHARADEILALTYTENAGKEMRQRVAAELSEPVSPLQVTTFHSYANRLLLRNRKTFGLLDDKDLWIYLRKRIRELELNYFVRAANVGQFLDDLLDFIQRCQDELVGPDRYADYVSRLERGEVPIPRVTKTQDADRLRDDEVLGRCREIAAVFSKVEEMLASEQLGTFGHMIPRAYALLRQDQAILAAERRRARFILVDEFQDANFAQVKLLQHLAGEEANVFAVGDPDQAIYRFRGASSAAFALFVHNFPGAPILALKNNRRSTTAILRCAYALISKNPDRLGSRRAAVPYQRSPLVSWREEEAARRGETSASSRVEVVLASGQGKELEARDVVSVLRQRHQKQGVKWGDFAVLYRHHQHRDELVEELARQKVPFSIENMDVLDTSEARDLFACVGAIVSLDNDASLLRVAALPQFRINPEVLRAGIRALPRELEQGGVASVLEQMEDGLHVLAAREEVRAEIAETSAKSLAALDLVIAKFGFEAASPVLAAIREFVRAWEQKPMVETGELSELLEYMEYFQQARGAIPMTASPGDAVHLMTAHAAKGLEFQHVFILRANSNSFPTSYRESLVEFPRELRDPDSVAQQDDKTLHGAEERRLFYVAMTRARDTLTIHAKCGTGQDPTPAGFLRDLLKDPSLRPFLCQRAAQGFDTASLLPTTPAPRLSQWIDLPPTSEFGQRLSASAVEMYESCPLQFKLDREWRIPGEVPAALQYGATMHRVLRAYYDSLRFEQTMSDEGAIEFFRADLRDSHIQDPYQYHLYEKQGVAQLKDFLATAHRVPAPEVLHTEEFFAIGLPGTNIVGRIDRIDRLPNGQIVITDYKTGKPRSQEDADESLQLSIYAWAAREKWGYRADRLVFYNLEENGVVATTRNEMQLNDAKQKVEEVAGKIAAGEFHPRPGFHCRFCAYRSLCPATEKRVYSVAAPSLAPAGE